MTQENGDRKKSRETVFATEQELSRLNRILQTLYQCNHALVHATDEQELFRAICQILVEVGELRLAWVGQCEDDAEKSVWPVAKAGYGLDYVENAKISWGEETERGRGPTGIALRTGIQPTLLEESGLIAALQKLVERSHIPGWLRCNFLSTGIPEESLPPSVQKDLLRIAQEAMSNAVRHAKPTVITVSLSCDPPNLVLEVTDNEFGISNPQAALKEGFGLSNLQGRGRTSWGPVEGSNFTGSRHKDCRSPADSSLASKRMLRSNHRL